MISGVVWPVWNECGDTYSHMGPGRCSMVNLTVAKPDMNQGASGTNLYGSWKLHISRHKTQPRQSTLTQPLIDQFSYCDSLTVTFVTWMAPFPVCHIIWAVKTSHLVRFLQQKPAETQFDHYSLRISAELDNGASWAVAIFGLWRRSAAHPQSLLYRTRVPQMQQHQKDVDNQYSTEVLRWTTTIAWFGWSISQSSFLWKNSSAFELWHCTCNGNTGFRARASSRM